MLHCKNITAGLCFLQSQRRPISKTVSDTKAGLTLPFHSLWSSIQTKSSRQEGTFNQSWQSSNTASQLGKNQKGHQTSFHGFSSSKASVWHNISQTTWSWLVNARVAHCKRGPPELSNRTSLEGRSWNAEKGIDDAQAIQKLLDIQLRYLVGPSTL